MNITIQTEVLSDDSKVYNILLVDDDDGATCKIAMDSRGAANDVFTLLVKHGSWMEITGV